MGSTHSVRKHVGAVADARTGRFNYVLIEQTYESNVHPHTPSWSTVTFGSYDDCMRKIILASASCEGGSLKHGSWVRPEAYIRAWRRAFEEPTAMRSTRVTGCFGGGLYDIAEDRRPAIVEILSRHGITLTDEGGLELDLETNAGAAAEILNVRDDRGRAVSAWKLISHDLIDRSTILPTAAVHVRPTDGAGLIDAVVHRLPGQRLSEPDHVLTINGESKVTGWAYATVQAFADDIAQAETQRPGCAEGLFRHARDAVASAKQIPMETTVTINRAACKWGIDRVDKLLGALALDASVDELTTSMQTIVDRGALDAFHDAPRDAIGLRLPAPALVHQTSGQLDLVT